MSKFKVGDMLRVSAGCSTYTRDHIRSNGGNIMRMEVRSLDRDGDPVFTYECPDMPHGFYNSDEQFELIGDATNNFYVIKRFARGERPYPVLAKSLDEAKQWVVENGKEGEEYHIQESIKHGPFRVASKTINTLVAV